MQSVNEARIPALGYSEPKKIMAELFTSQIHVLLFDKCCLAEDFNDGIFT